MSPAHQDRLPEPIRSEEDRAPPGLVKTLAMSTIAHVTGASFTRLQFTPAGSAIVVLVAGALGALLWSQRLA